MDGLPPGEARPYTRSFQLVSLTSFFSLPHFSSTKIFVGNTGTVSLPDHFYVYSFVFPFARSQAVPRRCLSVRERFLCIITSYLISLATALPLHQGALNDRRFLPTFSCYHASNLGGLLLPADFPL